jgi:hypothetical protein
MNAAVIISNVIEKGLDFAAVKLEEFLDFIGTTSLFRIF